MNTRVRCASPFLLRSLPVLLALAAPAWAQTAPPGSDPMAEIAKNLANPVADLISVPLQNNWDYHLGTTDATLYTLNVQPVIPIGLDDRYILVTRTIIPYVSYEALAPGTSGAGGLGDTQASIFLTTRETTKGGWLLGVGPILQLPTATSRSTGSGKWGAGPTVIVVRQDHGWTYGLLASHTWSFAGTESRASVNSTFLEPFLTYTTKTYTTLGVFTESAYNWTEGKWTVPVEAMASQVLMLAGQPFSITFGGRYWAESPAGGPDWGLRLALTLIFQENKEKAGP
ncbi:MAG: transporter [Thermoanaerobaculia bacterium]